MLPVDAPVPDAAVGARRKQSVPREADLLGQFAPRRHFWRLAEPDSATREVPRDPIRRAHQQQRLTDVNRYQRTLMPLAPQSPPDSGERETKAIRCLPGGVANRGRSGVLKVWHGPPSWPENNSLSHTWLIYAPYR